MGLERPLTIGEYFDFEEAAESRHEFHDGEILAMAGTTYRHGIIVVNLTALLRQHLRGTACRPLDSNMRIRVFPRSKYVYADLTVVCGKPQFDPSDTKLRTIINPKVVVEILSESTESYDRERKFDLYRQIASFEEYILISQHQPMIETFLRQEDGSWRFETYKGMETDAVIRSLPLQLPLNEVYADVEFDPVVDLPAE